MPMLRESVLTLKQRLVPIVSLFASRRRTGLRWLARNGKPITLRIVRDDDGPAIQAFVSSLSVKSRYHRFFYPLHELTPDLLERFLQADPTREVTLLATTEQDGRDVMIGMAQYFVNAEGRAEFAIAVADAWQRNGIGKSMLYALSWLARAAGITWFDGDVLMENTAMRGLLTGAGFMFRSHPEGGNLVRASKRLTRPEGKCSRLSAFLAQVGAKPVRRLPAYA